MESFINIPLRHPWKVLLLFVVFSITVSSGVKRFTFSNDYRDYFSKANPQLAAWEQLQQIYSKTDNVLIAVSAKQGDLFTPEKLAAIESITDEAWFTPHTSRVDSITNFQYVAPGNDELVVRNLAAHSYRFSKLDLDGVKAIALQHPLIVDRLINPSGTVAAVNIVATLPEQPREQIAEISSYIYSKIDLYKSKFPQLDFYVTGSIPYNYALTSASKGDIKTFIPLMFFATLIITGFLIRSFYGYLISFVIVTLSIWTTMGAAGWMGVTLMAPSLSVPTIVMTIAIANCIYLFMSFYQHYELNDKSQAIRRMLQMNFTPILITNITTAIGFLSMNFSEVPPYRDMGNMVAGGLLFIILLSLLLFPALLRLIPLKRKKPDRHGSRWIAAFGAWVLSHHKAVVYGSVFTCAAILFGLSKLHLNDNFINWLDQRYTFRNDSDFINENLTGLFRLDWALSSGEEGGITNPDYLNTLERFKSWALQQKGVVYVDSFSDIIKEINMKLHNGDEMYYRIPPDRNTASQYLLTYELALPKGKDLSDSVDIGKKSSRFVMRTRNMSSTDLLNLEQTAKDWLIHNAPATMVSEAASTSILFANISKRNIQSLLGGTLIALVLIAFLLILPFRSITIGLLSLIPNLIPALIGFGLWGLAVGEVGLAISIVVGMTLGIVVDDTVHFLHKYLYYRRESRLNAREALLKTYQTAGPGIVATSVALSLGFALLAHSGFAINAQMGALTSVIIVVALLADIMLLPALLIMFPSAGQTAPAATLPVLEVQTGILQASKES